MNVNSVVQYNKLAKKNSLSLWILGELCSSYLTNPNNYARRTFVLAILTTRNINLSKLVDILDCMNLPFNNILSFTIAAATVLTLRVTHHFFQL